MKIAIVLNRFYPEVGGAETNLCFQATELAKEHEVTVFTPRRLRETPSEEELNGFKVKRLHDWRNWRGRFPNIRRDTLMAGIFWRILFGNYDIVQAFPALNHNNMLALIAAKLRGIPFILCSFDLMDYAEMEKKDGFIRPDCLDGFKPGRIRRMLLGWCSHIFAISNREIAALKKYNSSVSFSPVPIQLAEYEAAAPSIVREKFHLGASSMLFLALGRVSRIKGQDLAVSAFCRAKEKLSPDARLVIVGRSDYEPELLAKMQREIAENHLDDRVIFTGMIDRADVIAFLQQSDVSVVPVRFMNSGAVIVEAWAAGTPVIQSDSVDPNLLEDGRNGFLFVSENVDQLADCMIRACNLRAELKSMGARGREKVLSGFTYPHLIQIYNDMYRELSGKRGK